ncbi:MAG: DUF616 domain-containing protein [Mangrovicoccus sp.]|nr:DUF616 domain-containing protein [Mangrovicoccus sp.]
MLVSAKTTENAILKREKRATEAQLESLRCKAGLVEKALVEARRKPIKQMGKLLQYKLLRLLSMSRPLVSEKAATRFANSAAKRHPSKMPGPKQVRKLQPLPTAAAEIDQPIAVDDAATKPHDTAYFVESNALAARLLPVAGSGFWDEDWYFNRHQEEIAAAAKRDERITSALHHYLLEGWKKGYEPAPNFTLKRSPLHGEDPITHFLTKLLRNGYQFEDNVWFPSSDELEQYTQNKASRQANRVIYTCIAGGYDELMQPKYIDAASDYICFTDQADLLTQGEIGVWTMRALRKVQGNESLSNRWHKLHPHLLFPEYQESIYIDGNVNVLSSYLFDKISEHTTDLLLPRHFMRNCVMEEKDTIISTNRINKSAAEKLDSLMQKAKSEGFPEGWGLSENNVIFRNHHDPKIIALMEEWWEMVETVAPRDQAHLCYLLWKHGFSFEDITFPNCRTLYQDFAVVRHNTSQEITLRNVIQQKLTPAFGEDAVAVVMSCNEAFVSYLDVLLSSIASNSNPERCYDIIILHRDVSAQSQQRLINIHGAAKNFSVRFYDMSTALAALQDMELHLEGYVPVETYNKIFLKEILEGYGKIAYIDTDIIVNRDIADLFDIDLCGRAIGSSPNIANIHAANAGKWVKERDFKDYLQRDLGILNISQYFQAGILLLDLKHRNTRKLFRDCVEKINEVLEPAFFDQCIFNSVFYGDVHYFSTEWNLVWYLQNYSYLRNTVPEEMFFDYARSRNQPSIVHFASGDKPTNKTDWRLGEYFWKYALQSQSKDVLLDSLAPEHRNAPQVTSVLAGQTVIPEMIRVLVHIHLYYEDQLPFMLETIDNLGDFPRDVYFTIQQGSQIDQAAIAERVPGCHFIELPNLGYDLFPYLEVLRHVPLSKYDYILKMHTKAPRSEEQGSVYGIDVPGYAWRDALIGSLAGSREIFAANIERLESDRSLGALGCKDFIFSTEENREETTYNLPGWRSYLNVDHGNTYVGGTMFLARSFPFEHFRKLYNQPELFRGEAMSTKSHKDFAHVLERFCGIVVENEGLRIEGA